MISAPPRIGRWKLCWPLVLLALATRIGLGSLALPTTAVLPAATPGAGTTNDPLARVSGLLVLCDGHSHHDGTPRPPPPADAGDGVLLLFADLLAVAALPAGPVPFRPLLLVASAASWCFPPVRGPPPSRAAALYAQGPPA